MDHFHTRTHKLKGNISPDIQENIKYTTQIMQDCNDLVQKQFKIGIDHEISIYIVYMDGLVNTEMLQESVIRPLLQDSFPQERTAISQYVIESADWKWIDTMEDAMTAVLSGNTILFLGGEARAILFSSKLFPTRGVQNADQEVAIVGPKDSFTESLRMNTALIRRRIRDTRLKVIQKQIGTRSKTDYALMYIEDLVQKDILNKIQKQMDKICVDGIFDNGMLQQYLEKDSKTPFPLYQLTQRPDKVASSIMEGRIAVVLDNSPMVLLLPVTFNVFFQASDDYYNRWEITTFVRILRYIAAIISIGLPGFYVAIAGFHPEVLPTPFLLALISAREGVPFPVIVVALTAIATFSIPNELFTSAFRLMKFFLIILCAFWGLYGFFLGFLAMFIHLFYLENYGVPYAHPMVEERGRLSTAFQDFMVRYPLKRMKYRPEFTKEGARVRQKEDEDEK